MAKMNKAKPGIVQKFMCYIGGTLISDGNYEENDPQRQLQNFEEQLEQQRQQGLPDYPRDPDFIEALRYGLPPLAGAAIGIDRLTMLVTGASHIRDVIAFRPRKLDGQQ
jgi:lysyl-tRNA synthetase class II